MKPKQLFTIILIFICLNINAQWQQTNGPYGGYINALASDGTNIFAGTDGGGVWKRPLSEMTGIAKNSDPVSGGTHFMLYPNPATETLTISLSSNMNPPQADYEIYDLTGRKLERNKVVNSHQLISVKNYTNGIYLIKISDGEKIYTKNFIKE